MAMTKPIVVTVFMGDPEAWPPGKTLIYQCQPDQCAICTAKKNPDRLVPTIHEMMKALHPSERFILMLCGDCEASFSSFSEMVVAQASHD